MQAVKNLPIASPDPKELFRMKIHDQVDKWIDELLGVFEEDQQPTLEQISALITETRQRFLATFVQHIVETKYAGHIEQDSASCPQCGQTCKVRRRGKKTLETLHGVTHLTRPWFYCTKCNAGFSPLDNVLELSRKEKQLDIQRRCIELSAHLPFETASVIFERLTGQAVSDHFIHDTFERVGRAIEIEDVIPSANEIAQRIEEARRGTWRPILVVAADGAHMPTRPKARRNEKRGPGCYQEAKGFRLFLVGKRRIISLVSWHQIQNEADFGSDLALVAKRVPQHAVRIALIGDGAGWLWKHMTACFPKGREILDCYHCAQHVYEVAKAHYGEKSLKSLQWVEATLCRLFYAEVGHVIAGLRRMKPKDARTAELIRKLMGYLNNNRRRIHYRSDRLGGYPIGSGAIESANKFICHTRLKRSGAWWIKVNGNAMLRIRCALYNGTFDRAFERYKAIELNRCGWPERES